MFGVGILVQFFPRWATPTGPWSWVDFVFMGVPLVGMQRRELA